MFKNFLILTIFSASMLVYNSSCGSSDEQAKNDRQISNDIHASALQSNNQTNYVEAKKTNVFNLQSVRKSTDGRVPDFTWIENGKEMSFHKLTEGKVVFLNFWGTWCPPCRAELPDIIAIDKELANEDFIIIGIAVNERVPNPVDHVASFAESRGIKYKNFIDGNRELSLAFGGIPAVPTTIIIDKNKRISETLVGARSKNDFMASINRVLKK